MTLDYPDLTLLGWTPTDDQWTAAVAVVIGAAGAGLVMILSRRARRAVLAGAVALAVCLAWWFLLR
jgi:hypothetical protein